IYFRQLGQGDKIRQRLVNGLAQALLLAGGIGGSVEQGVVPGEIAAISALIYFRQLGQGDKIRQRLVNGLAQALLLAGGIGG
ncbi:hypothetical protein C0U44_31035, partial [Klebsiella pneumoniae]